MPPGNIRRNVLYFQICKPQHYLYIRRHFPHASPSPCPPLADNLRLAGLYYPLGIAKKAPPPITRGHVPKRPLNGLSRVFKSRRTHLPVRVKNIERFPLSSWFMVG